MCDTNSCTYSLSDMNSVSICTKSINKWAEIERREGGEMEARRERVGSGWLDRERENIRLMLPLNSFIFSRTAINKVSNCIKIND